MFSRHASRFFRLTSACSRRASSRPPREAMTSSTVLMRAAISSAEERAVLCSILAAERASFTVFACASALSRSAVIALSCSLSLPVLSSSSSSCKRQVSICPFISAISFSAAVIWSSRCCSVAVAASMSRCILSIVSRLWERLLRSTAILPSTAVACSSSEAAFVRSSSICTVIPLPVLISSSI